MKTRKVVWRVGLGLALVGILLSGSIHLQAADYTVGTGQTYSDLKDLQSKVTLADGDTITLYDDEDSSLAGHISIPPNINTPPNISITVKSNLSGETRTITPTTALPPDDFQVPSTGGFIDFTKPATGTATNTLILGGIAIDGFSAAANLEDTGRGGAVHSDQTLIIQSLFGTNVFTGNSVTGMDGTYTGEGGAIFARELTIGNGTYVFTGNSATNGIGNQSGQGGALYSATSTTIEGGTLALTGNQAEGSGASSGRGGAMYSTYLTEFGDGQYTFTGNTVTGGDGSGSGTGGAVYAGSVKMEGGEYQFTGNKAFGGTGTGGGLGGAIHAYGTMDTEDVDGNIADGKVNFTGGTFDFSGNSATGGTDSSKSGLGGAIYAYSGITAAGDEFTFTQNIATGSGDSSGRGGAIYANNGLSLTSANSVFDDNEAAGGSGTRAGLGGAIFANGDVNLAGNLAFTGNRAIGSGSDSGLGGAIFRNVTHVYDPEEEIEWTFRLATTAPGQNIIFSGNTQNGVANGIYFGSDSAGIFTDTVTLFAGEGTGIFMYDPMESQADRSEEDGIIVNLSKTGTGLWYLGGTSNLNSAATVAINEGTFKMERDAALNLNHSGIGAFSVAGGATFNPTVFGTNTYSKIKGSDVLVEPGAKLIVSGISSLPAGDVVLPDAMIVSDRAIIDPGFVYRPDSAAPVRLYTDAQYVANGKQQNQDLVIRGVRNLSDTFGVRPFWDSYRRMDLSQTQRDIFDEIYQTGTFIPLPPEWQRKLFILDGGGVVNAADARRVNADMFSRVMFDHILDHQAPGRHNHRRNIENYDNDPYDSFAVVRGQSADSACVPAYRSDCDASGNVRCRGRDLWGVFTQNWTGLDDSDTLYGYEYRPFAISFGSDRQFGCWTFGLAAQYAHGTVKSGDIDYTHTTMDAATLGVYAGRFWDRYYVIGNMQFGTGWNKESTYVAPSALVDGTYNTGSYNSATLGTSMEFGRTFRFGCIMNPCEITPHVGTDYYFINSEAFTESGGPMIRSFGSVNYNVVEIPFGVRMAKYFRAKGGRLDWCRPSVDVMYVRSVADDVPVTTVSMTGLALPIPAWDAPGMSVGRDIFRMSAGVMGRYCDCVDVGLSYDLDARNNYTSQQLNAGITWNR